MMRRGWFGESYRHFLARKGVATVPKRQVNAVLRAAGYSLKGKQGWVQDVDAKAGYKKVFRSRRGPERHVSKVVQAEFGTGLYSPRVGDYASLQEEWTNLENRGYVLGLRRNVARRSGQKELKRELKEELRKVRERQGEIRKKVEELEFATDYAAKQEVPESREVEGVPDMAREELREKISQEKSRAMQERLKMREFALFGDKARRASRLQREELVRAGALAQSPELFESWLSRQVPVASRARIRVKGDVAGTTRRVRMKISGEKGKSSMKRFGIGEGARPLPKKGVRVKREDTGIVDLGGGSVIFTPVKGDEVQKVYMRDAEVARLKKRVNADVKMGKEMRRLQKKVAPVIEQAKLHHAKRRRPKEKVLASFAKSGIEVVE